MQNTIDEIVLMVDKVEDSFFTMTIDFKIYFKINCPKIKSPSYIMVVKENKGRWSTYKHESNVIWCLAGC